MSAASRGPQEIHQTTRPSMTTLVFKSVLLSCPHGSASVDLLLLNPIEGSLLRTHAVSLAAHPWRAGWSPRVWWSGEYLERSLFDVLIGLQQRTYASVEWDCSQRLVVRS